MIVRLADKTDWIPEWHSGKFVLEDSKKKSCNLMEDQLGVLGVLGD